VLSKLQALIFLVTIVVLALTMICVATTMSAVVEERRKEIGLRKAIGASDGSIIKEFMGEGVMLGLAGGILGSILGFIFAQTVAVNVFSGSITFRPLLVPITIIVSIAVTALASMSPIKSATSVDPALVLKGE
jgi:putative ABC transport system permease protein